MIIAPSILAADLYNLERELQSLEQLDDLWIHLDIMDGHFVPNLTFGIPLIEHMAKKTKHKLDAHLMVSNPAFYVKKCEKYSLHNMTFHVESFPNQKDCLDLVCEAKKHYPSVGISVKPKTELETLSEDLLKNIDLFLLMSVEPGFAGQSFIEASLEKLKKLMGLREKLGASFMIQVDGGIDNTNAKTLESYGVENIVTGFYFFKDGPRSYGEKLNLLRSKVCG